MEKETVSGMAISGIRVVEHLPHHPKAEGLSANAPFSTRKEGKDMQILQPLVAAL